jgi:hypothetical protein
MPTYIYVPVSTPEMTRMTKDWNDGRQATGKPPYHVIANDSTGTEKEFRRGFGMGFLEHVAAGDRLYVIAHGIGSDPSGGALTIGNTRGGKLQDTRDGVQVVGGVSKNYNDAKFARHLDKEGLTKSFVDLRLFCCRSGLKTTDNGNALGPYALRLRNAMFFRGFHSIQVTGYLGDLKVNGSYYEKGTKTLTSTYVAGEGAHVTLVGEKCPMYFKDYAVKF